MQNDGFSHLVEKINAGEEVPPVAQSFLEAMWKAYSEIPRERREQVAFGLGIYAKAGIDPATLPDDPDVHIAAMMRFALLECLVERGFLSEYMGDEAERKRVFAAAAELPFNKEELAEAKVYEFARRSGQGVAELQEEFRKAGYDPDHPKIAEKVKQWMREH